MPVTVIVEMPEITGPLAVKVRVVEDGSLVGLKPAVIPDGNPEAVKVTEPLKPLSLFIVMAEVAMPPWASVRFGEPAERE